MVLWVLTPCGTVDAERRFRGKYRQKYFPNITTTSLQMIGAGNFSKTLLISYQTPRHHKQSNGYFAVAFYRAVLLLNSINLLNTFYYQLTHTTLKNVVIKNSKIDKNAPTCFGLHGNHLQGAKVSTWLKVTLAP